jgi:hypothetical protein
MGRTMDQPGRPQSGTLAAAHTRTITAVDITGNPELRGLWIPGYEVYADRVVRAGLAPAGVASPLGYWLVAHEGNVSAPADGMRLVRTAPGEELAESTPASPAEGQAGRRFRTQTIRIKARGPEQGEVVLTVGPGSAHVSATESAWTALAEPIILVVCQIWRFQAIDADLDRLTRDALENLDYANAPGLGSLPQSRRLTDLGWKTRAAIVDLTYFQKPLTDPSAYFDARRSARTYRLLADRFGLDEWCESIDHRAEVVEGTFETITEKLYHLKSHVHDVVLEVVIVVILLFDVLMRIWELMV